MKQNSFKLKSVTGKNLYGHIWLPATEVKAVIILIHGFGEHCLRYTSYINQFSDNGLAFISMDQLGHGQSEGKRGVIKSYQQLLDDIDQLINKAEEYFPQLPKFIYGHSMGGNIVFNHLLQRNFPFKGGIISSPWLKLVNDLNPLSKLLVCGLSCFIPNMTIKSGLESKYISTSKPEVDKYAHDELNHGRISFRLLNSIINQGKWAMRNTHHLKTPCLLVHGNKDYITSHIASKQTAQKGSHLITYHEYDGMYHEIHNDLKSTQLADDCIKWINIRLNH